uniref:Reverse transcriptase domain-containing protein n=1 Tax=Latimeria chalumnae TaxID=7897 RepID=H3A543_LATCH
GIFQGDSLSPMLFIIFLLPLTTLLKKSGLGFTIHNFTISHLLYMDDLKLYAKSDKDILALTKITFSNDICMQFGLDKYATVTINRGQVVRGNGLKLLFDEVIDPLPLEESYKYLGILEHGYINNTDVKKKATMKYKKRLHQLLKSRLSEQAWTDYVPRRKGGRGLKSIEDFVFKERCALSEYLKHSTTPALKLVSKEKMENTMEGRTQQDVVETSRAVTSEISEDVQLNEEKNKKNSRYNSWKQKVLHGQYIQQLGEDANIWLTKCHLKGETEALLIAAQDQALNTNSHRVRILHSGTESKCRMCKAKEETVAHIISGCKILAKGSYKERHNITRSIHWALCKKANIEVTNQWWKHQPKAVEEITGVKILWDFGIRTEREIQAHRPVFVDKTNRKAKIIDIACTIDYNIREKKQEKIMKYQDLKMEIEKLWKVRMEVIPVVIGALGAVTKKHEDYI